MDESMLSGEKVSTPAENLKEEKHVEIWEKMTYVWPVGELLSSFEKGVDYRLQSPLFSSSDEGIFKWYISIFPNGKSKEYRRFVSLFLRLVSAPSETFVKFSLTITTADSITLESKKLLQIFPPGGLAWGWYAFMPRYQLTSHLEEGKDLIMVQALIKTQLRDFESKPKIPNALSSLLENPKYSDVTLSVHGNKIPAHRNILAIRSKVFCDMFDTSGASDKPKYIKILNLTLATAMQMLRFMYTSTVDIKDCDEASALIQAANAYALDDLKSTCFEYVTSKLDVSNVIQIYCIADAYDAKELTTYAMEYICDHSGVIFSSEDPYTRLKDSPKLLDKIMNRLFPDKVTE